MRCLLKSLGDFYPIEIIAYLIDLASDFPSMQLNLLVLFRRLQSLGIFTLFDCLSAVGNCSNRRLDCDASISTYNVALRWDFHNVPWYGAQKLCLIFWFQPGNCNSLTFYDYWSDQVSFILNRNPFEILSMMMTGDPLFVVVGEKKDFFWEREGNGKLLPFKGSQSVWI